MHYNLLESHKEFARWLVDQHRKGNLKDSFSLVFRSNGDFVIHGWGSLEQ